MKIYQNLLFSAECRNLLIILVINPKQWMRTYLTNETFTRKKFFFLKGNGLTKAQGNFLLFPYLPQELNLRRLVVNISWLQTIYKEKDIAKEYTIAQSTN